MGKLKKSDDCTTKKIFAPFKRISTNDCSGSKGFLSKSRAVGRKGGHLGSPINPVPGRGQPMPTTLIIPPPLWTSDLSFSLDSYNFYCFYESPQGKEKFY